MITRTITILPVSDVSLNQFIQTALVNKGQFGTTIVTETDEHALQKRALANLLGRKVEVKKITEISNLMMGWNYERVVQARLERAGEDPNNFAAEAPTGKQWVPNMVGLLLEKIADPAVKYLRSYVCKATKVRRVYTVDGALATPAEEAAIKQCLRDPGPARKQYAAGITSDNEVTPRDYTLSNIYGVFNKAWGISLGIDYDSLVAAL